MSRAIVIRFSGGSRDGEELASDSNNKRIAEDAKGLYAMTGEGKLGHEILLRAGVAAGWISMGRIEPWTRGKSFHRYKVVDRSEAGDRIVITLEIVAEQLADAT